MNTQTTTLSTLFFIYCSLIIAKIMQNKVNKVGQCENLFATKVVNMIRFYFFQLKFILICTKNTTTRQKLDLAEILAF